MKKAILFCNGDLTDLSQIRSHISKGDYIICADGGTSHALSLDLIPHMIIGDCDSLKSSIKKQLLKHNIEWIVYPKDKDKSDSELALDLALKRGFKKIIICGILGTRIDHLLTNFFLLAKYLSSGVSLSMIEGRQELIVIKNKTTINCQKGDLFSLIPLQNDCLGLSTQGLKFSLDNEPLQFGSSRGVSNVATTSRVEIKLKKGLLIVIWSKKSYNRIRL